MYKISGIYQIQSLSNPQRCYVGSAINLQQRWRVHLSTLRKGIHHSLKLQRHFNKYLELDLIFIIIEPCLPEFLIIREQYYIDKLSPYFNNCKVAGSLLGMKHSEETLKKMSLAHKGQTPWIKGKHHSNESKFKIAIAAKGKKPYLGHKHSDDTKLKMSELRKGQKKKPLSDEVCKKISESLKGNIPINKGKHYTEEIRQKINDSNGMRGKKHTPETCKKMSDAKKGKLFSEDHKMKLSLSHKKRFMEKNMSVDLKYYENKRMKELEMISKN